MASGDPSGKADWLRLKDDFRAEVAWLHGMRGEFLRWAAESYPDVALDPHHWRPMRDGRPVPAEQVRLFSEFLSDKHDRRYLASQIAEPCGPEAIEPDPNPRFLGWPRLFEVITRRFAPPVETYCKDDDDIKLAAGIILEAVGELEGDAPLTGRAARRRGERIMRRSHDELARQLAMFRRADEKAVLFATWRDGGVLHRVGVSVVVPVTKEFYARFRGGAVEDIDLARRDIAVPSKFLFCHAYADYRTPGLDARRDPGGRGLAQTHTVLWQLASLCPSMHKASPRLIAVAGTPENEKGMRAYRFVPTGAITPLTGKAVMEIAPPRLSDHGAAYFGAAAHFATMKALLGLYQSIIYGRDFFDD
jgi:hypothetical protein